MSETLSLFKSGEHRRRYLLAYENALKTWPVPYEEFDVPTSFRDTHVVACNGGAPADAPLRSFASASVLNSEW